MAHNQFRWFEYKGRGMRFATDKAELRLKTGLVFGLRTISDKFYITDVENKITIRIDQADYHRLIANSKGFSGTIKKTDLKPGVGALDKKDREEGYVKIDSGMFTRGKYDPKKKTLTLEFRNGAVWQYDNVSAKEVMAFEKAKSQGSYYNEAIKAAKESHRMESLSSSEPYIECVASIYTEDALPQPVEGNEDIGEGDRVTMTLNGKEIVGCVVGSVDIGTSDVTSTFGVFTPILPGAYLKVPKVPLTALTRDTFTAGASAHSMQKYGIYEETDLPPPPTEASLSSKFNRGSRVKVTFESGPVEGCVVHNYYNPEYDDNSTSYTLYVPIAPRLYTLIRNIPEAVLEACGCGPKTVDIFESIIQYLKSEKEGPQTATASDDGFVSESSAYTVHKYETYMMEDLPPAPPPVDVNATVVNSGFEFEIGQRVTVKMHKDGYKIPDCVVMSRYQDHDRTNAYNVCAPLTSKFYVMLKNVPQIIIMRNVEIAPVQEPEAEIPTTAINRAQPETITVTN